MKVSREYLVADETAVAVRKARTTLNKVGDLTGVEPGVGVNGKMLAFGARTVLVRITWREDGLQAAAVPSFTSRDTAAANGPRPKGGVPAMESAGTIMLLEAESDDGSPGPANNALDRFEDAYRNFDNPHYKADRAGMLPATILGLVAVAILLIVFFLKSPIYARLMPAMPAAYLKDAKEVQAEAAAERNRREEAGETVEAAGTP